MKSTLRRTIAIGVTGFAVAASGFAAHAQREAKQENQRPKLSLKAQPNVGIAPARFRRDGDFAGKLAEERTPFRVDRAFEPLNLGPFAVSRHEMGIL